MPVWSSGRGKGEKGKKIAGGREGIKREKRKEEGGKRKEEGEKKRKEKKKARLGVDGRMEMEFSSYWVGIK